MLEVPYGDLLSLFLVPPTPSCVGLRCHATHLTLPSLPVPSLSPSLSHPRYSTHGVVVTPHGASLMNLMLMPPLSAVVELFPYHLHHALYMVSMCGSAGLTCPSPLKR